ncbi:general stress protein [Planococcus dechangensis]|uniref:General stress protein n=1 Tax=Planococcus dechangensis TaxID=1176255 RepID=A0ABV9MFA1_9BACL
MSRVVGAYDTEMEAVEVIEDLQHQGYRSEDISVISKDKKDVEQVTQETGTQAGEGAAAGAATGGALGGLGGVLAGLGALAIPGIGPIVAAGPIAAGLTGAVAGAGVGGIAGALIGIGVPEDEARDYETQFKEGRILVLLEDGETVQPADRNDVDTYTETDEPLIGSERSTTNRSGQGPSSERL